MKKEYQTNFFYKEFWLPKQFLFLSSFFFCLFSDGTGKVILKNLLIQHSLKCHRMASYEGYKQMSLPRKCQNQMGIKEKAK